MTAAHTASTPDGQELYQRVGELTRMLHDALRELGYDQQLESAASTLPDARTRLSYIARLTGEAAGRVLDTVDLARAEQEALAGRVKEFEVAFRADPVAAVSRGHVLDLAQDVLATGERTNAHLTEIMMAQDFHDLTGQVIRKVVDLAHDLEAQLLKLLVESTPPAQRAAVEAKQPAAAAPSGPSGPAMNAAQRTDVVTDQSQVDDLLESLGF